jgi:AraC-like DNA-binding protein
LPFGFAGYQRIAIYSLLIQTMNHSFSIFEVIVLVGIIQGSVIAFLIWFYKRKNISKLLLSAVLIVFNILCAKILIHTFGLWKNPYVRYFPLSIEMLIQPLFWLYVLALVNVNFKFTKKYWLHFTPFFIFFGYSLVVYLFTLQTFDLSKKDVIANGFSFNAIKQFEDLLSIFSSIIYATIGTKLIFQYRKWLNDNTSNTDYPTYAWLRNIILFTVVLIIMLTIAISVDTFFNLGVDIFIHWQIFFVYLAGVIYYLGFKGYTLPDNSFTLKQLSIEQQNFFLVEELNMVEVIAPSKGIDLLSEKRKQEIKESILNALEKDKRFLDPELSTQKLAKELNIGISNLSWVINNCFDKSFRNLINEYRIEEVKTRLKDPKSRIFSTMGIAYDCGFNSEASLVFKFKISYPKEIFLSFTPKFLPIIRVQSPPVHFNSILSILDSYSFHALLF